MDTTFLKYNEQAIGNIIAWKTLLKNISLEQIHKQFEEYELFCHHDLTSFNSIEKKINSLFLVDYAETQFPLHFKYIINIEKRPPNNPYYFFRIREMKKGSYIDMCDKKIIFDTMEFEEIQTINDVWERPVEQVTSYQRLSKPHNTVLYTSLMPSTAILELDIQPKNLFFLIIYKHKCKFKFSDCCRFVYYNELSEEENLKRYVMFTLLRNEFTRILPKGYKEQNQYCSAYTIAKRFFIGDNVAAIQYPSTRGLGHKNFAFFENNIRNNLEFVGLRLCMLQEKKGTSAKMICFANGFWNDELNKFEYHSLDSDKSKEVFTPILNIMMSK